MVGISNRLPVLAADIRRAHDAAQKAATLAAGKAIEAGHALVEAKALVGHGGWLPFLADAGVPERTAQRHMTLARSGLKSDTVSDLGGITGALRFLGLRQRGSDLLKGASKELRAGGDELARIEAAIPHLEAAVATIERLLAMFPEEEILEAKRARAR